MNSQGKHEYFFVGFALSVLDAVVTAAVDVTVIKTEAKATEANRMRPRLLRPVAI